MLISTIFQVLFILFYLCQQTGLNVSEQMWLVPFPHTPDTQMRTYTCSYMRVQETRYRQRYLDLICNHDVRNNFVVRAKVIQFVRKYLDEKKFLEVGV